MTRERTPVVDIALAIPVRDGRFLVARRAGEDHQGGYWEFPGGKIGPEEKPVDAARRELAEETGLEGGEIEPLIVIVHDYPDRSVRLQCFLVHEPGGEVVVDRGRQWAWASRDELDSAEMPPANSAILRALRPASSS
jgi:8-oxo-dGTP diphosphatase